MGFWHGNWDPEIEKILEKVCPDKVEDAINFLHLPLRRRPGGGQNFLIVPPDDHYPYGPQGNGWVESGPPPDTPEVLIMQFQSLASNPLSGEYERQCREFGQEWNLLPAEADSWSDADATLYLLTCGNFAPTMVDDKIPSTGVSGRVSCVCVTTSERDQLHPQFHTCFTSQTYVDQELVILDTRKEPSGASWHMQQRIHELFTNTFV